MTFIMMIFFSLYAVIQPFPSKEACEEAKAAILAVKTQGTTYVIEPVFCIPSGVTR